MQDTTSVISEKEEKLDHILSEKQKYNDVFKVEHKTELIEQLDTQKIERRAQLKASKQTSLDLKFNAWKSKFLQTTKEYNFSFDDSNSVVTVSLKL